MDEKNELVENFHRFNNLKHATVKPKAFTEKGLYMLATILKSNIATQTTLAIIETYARIKHLSRNIKELSANGYASPYLFFINSSGKPCFSKKAFDSLAFLIKNGSLP